MGKPPDPKHPYFGMNLRYWRVLRGLGVNELGEKAGVSASLISAYEHGKQNPRYPRAVKLARALSVPVEYLWDHRQPPPQD